jgi:hypothetical protein
MVSTLQIYNIDDNFMNICFGNNILDKFEGLKDKFNTFIESINYKSCKIYKKNIIIEFSNISETYKTYIKTYWKGLHYNILVPHLESKILEQILFTNLHKCFQQYYLYYKHKNNMCELFINIFDDLEQHKFINIFKNELIKLNVYITCENCRKNKCSNTKVVKCKYNNSNKHKLQNYNTTNYRQISKIPLCQECHDNLLEHSCYSCLEQFQKNDIITSKCSHINHSIHYKCKMKEEKADYENITNKLNILTKCPICREQGNEHFDCESFQNYHGITSAEDEEEEEEEVVYIYRITQQEYDENICIENALGYI